MVKSDPDKFSEQFVLRVTPEAAAYLDMLMREGGYSSRAALMRSIIDNLMEDDLKAHGRPHVASPT